MFQNDFRVKGRVRLQCHKQDGSIKWDTGFIDNQIMNAGRAKVANMIGTIPSLVFKFLAVGTSSAAVTSAQTALGAEITNVGFARSSGVVSVVASAGVSAVHQVVHTWTAVSAKTIEEIGMFNAITGNVMLGRQLTTAKAVGVGETLTGTYQIIVG